MKKTAGMILSFLLLLCMIGCAQPHGGKLTMDTLRDMAAEKGETLTWSDLAQYPGVETGSGLYILVYEIDADYRLMIGGVPEDAPMYIYLFSTEDSDRRIDVRYEDIDGFLERMD